MNSTTANSTTDLVATAPRSLASHLIGSHRSGGAGVSALSATRRVHLLGAGGAGVSGAGVLLAALGIEVSGHDKAPSRFVDRLRETGIAVALGESRASALPAGVELVVRSAAVGDDDPQIIEAQRRGIPVWKYSECLARLAPPRRTLAVAGTHGKTTTAWLAFHALRGIAAAAGRGAPSPGALIGGGCRTVGANAVPQGDGGWFVAEACEYDRSFLHLAPEGAVVTNVEPDHLDYYGSIEAIEEAFARFADRIHPDGLLVVGRDVPDRIESASRATVWRLGREIDVVLCGEQHGYFRFRLIGPGFATPETALRVPGSFNVENASLALALAIGLAARTWHLNPADAGRAAARALEAYEGAERRFEPWGTSGGVELVHDYAHHPTEVRVTLEAARRVMPGKPIHVLFQPHQHSRTARFLDQFVESLRSADRVVVADVYGARKHIDTRAAGSEELAVRLRRAGVDAIHGGGLGTSVQRLLECLPGGSAALILGAGDVDRIQGDLVGCLALRGPAARGPVV